MSLSGSMHKIDLLWQRMRTWRWFFPLAALAGGIYYGVQSIRLAHRLVSGFDEGSFLVKGFLFVTGVYHPFQPYGPLINKMLFAFFIPGWAEAVFGPGLRTGRYLAIFLGLMMVLATWLIARRLAGQVWAAVIVWAMALNPFLVGVYSQALSEGLLACMLVWVYVLVLGKDRRVWHLVIGSLLTALVVLTRQNMLPIVVLLPLYVWWQHGWRKAALSLSLILIPVAIVHIIYWPQIFSYLYLPFLPKGIALFEPFRISGLGDEVWKINITPLMLTDSFFMGVRLHFLAVVGAAMVLVFWPRLNELKKHANYKAIVFLAVFFWIAFVLHMFGNRSDCPYCFINYLGFFIQGGYLLLAAMFSRLERTAGWLRQVLGVMLVLVAAAGVAFATRENTPWLVNILAWKVPRLKDLHIVPGTLDLWVLFYNKFGWTEDSLKQAIHPLAGLIVGIVVILAAGLTLVIRRKPLRMIGYTSMAGLLLVGAFLTPTLLLGGANPPGDCGDILAAYENVARQLNLSIPAGSQVYWAGGVATVPLVYLKDARIYPPQIGDKYTFRTGTDSDRIYRYGYWNQDLADRWLKEADVVLVEGWRLDDRLSSALRTGVDEVAPTIPLSTCKTGTEIHIYLRDH